MRLCHHFRRFISQQRNRQMITPSEPRRRNYALRNASNRLAQENARLHRLRHSLAGGSHTEANHPNEVPALRLASSDRLGANSFLVLVSSFVTPIECLRYTKPKTFGMDLPIRSLTSAIRILRIGD